MIKKFFFLALMLGVTFFASATAAVKNPAADPNLVLFYQHQGLESYFMRDSLQSSQKDSLQVISFKFIVYDSIRPENTHWERVNSMAFAYDESAKKAYFVEQDGNLRYLNPYGTTAEGSGYASGADQIYRIVFGKRFYS